jgi:hypothetical protein
MAGVWGARMWVKPVSSLALFRTKSFDGHSVSVNGHLMKEYALKWLSLRQGGLTLAVHISANVVDVNYNILIVHPSWSGRNAN